MTAPTTNSETVKRFLARITVALKDPHGPRPHLCLNRHPAHQSAQVKAELARFHACF